MSRSFVPAALTAAFALSFLAACGGSSGSGSGSVSATSANPGSPQSPCTTSSAATDKYMTVDSSSKTVTVVLDITGFSYDGYSNGQMTVCVPQGWKVTAQCTNKTQVPHSCAIVENANATSPAFSGAGTKDLTGGLQPGDAESFTFTPDRTGQFRIVCLVPGHEDAGMWDYFTVTSAGQPLIAS